MDANNIKQLLAQIPFTNFYSPVFPNSLQSSRKRRAPSSSSSNGPSSPPFKDLGTVIKAPLDSKRYKVIELQNGLKICLVSTCVHETSIPANDSVVSKSSTLSNLSGSADKTSSQFPPGTTDDTEFLENKIKFFNKTTLNGTGKGIVRAPKPASAATAPQDICPPLPIPPSKAPKLIKCCSQGPSTICVCVGAGSFHDPCYLNGLAHFVEHLIFLGSKQYPEPNTLFTKVFENGGSVNATTFAEYTNFYFQCKTRAFEECVSILVDGLTNPLFKKATVQKEIEAVDSEYSIKSTHDGTRVSDFLRHRARVGHPFQKFYWGNKKTLNKPCIFHEARRFKERYYRANYMTVCIQAPMPIEDLERFALKHFSDIPSSPSNWESPTQEILAIGEPYAKENFQTAYFIAPLTHLNCVMITWALPAKFWQNYECKPLDYIQYLLETTSKGGLKQYLRKNKWMSECGNMSINCCARDDYCRNSYCSMFTLSIFLTDLGYETNLGVVQAVFSYLKMLQRGGVRPYLFEEMQSNASNKFNYQNWDEMLQAGADIAVNMQSVQHTPHLLTSMTLITHFKPELIEEALGLMTARSANYIFVSRKNIPFCKDVAMPSKISFCKYDVYPQVYSTWEETEVFRDFAVPVVGSFSPKEISLSGGSGGTRKEFGYKCIGTLYQDDKLIVEYISEKKTPCLSPRVPSTCIYVVFTSPMVIGRTSRMKMAVMEYWTRLLHDRITEKVGNQFEHLFEFDVNCADDGIGVYVAGPRSHIVELLMLVVREFFGRFGEEDDMIAENLKVDKVREYMNEIYDVESLSDDIRAYLRADSRPSFFELRNELMDVSLEEGDLFRLIERFRKQMLVNVEISGSITTGEADGIVQLLTGKSCGLVKYVAPMMMPSIESRPTMLPLGTSLLAVRAVHPAYVTSVVTNFYQMNGWDDDNVRTGQFISILFHMLRRRFANQLRTVEQLGYTTRLIPMYDPYSGPVGLYAVAYTHPHKFSTWHVDNRIDGFFRTFFENELGSKEVQTYLIKRHFQDSDADSLLDEFANFYKENMFKEGKNFRKLSVQIEGYIPGTRIPPKIQDKLTAQGTAATGEEGGQSGKGTEKGMVNNDNGDGDSLLTLEYLEVADQYKKRMKRENIRVIGSIGQFKRTLELIPVP